MGKAESSYCFVCQRPVRSGYCWGTRGKPHPREPCPACSGCRTNPCDWRGVLYGCRRFTVREVR